jgi:large subunit ribosomal protein L21
MIGNNFGRIMNYAIIETGGKQYKVTEGQTVNVDRLEAEEGGSVQLDKVLLLADGDNITVGKPLVEGAKVMATVKKNGKDKKIIVFHYKSKVRERRKQGHRQAFTSLNIDKILPAGAEYVKPVKKVVRRKKTEEKAENGA